MAVLVPDDQLNALRSAPQPDPAPAPRPQLGQGYDSSQDEYQAGQAAFSRSRGLPYIPPPMQQAPQPVPMGFGGPSYDEGYAPAQTGAIAPPEPSTWGNPFGGYGQNVAQNPWQPLPYDTGYAPPVEAYPSQGGPAGPYSLGSVAGGVAGVGLGFAGLGALTIAGMAKSNYDNTLGRVAPNIAGDVGGILGRMGQFGNYLPIGTENQQAVNQWVGQQGVAGEALNQIPQWVTGGAELGPLRTGLGIAGQIAAERGANALPNDTPYVGAIRAVAPLVGGSIGAAGPEIANLARSGSSALDRFTNPAVLPRIEYGRTPQSDSLFTAGPQGEVVGPTGNVAEMRLGREPVMGEDVNAGLRRTAYGRAQQEQLAAEEQAAFRDAGERAISGAVPDQTLPRLGGGAGELPPLEPGEVEALLRQKIAEGMTPEQALADPEVQAIAGRLFHNDLNVVPERPASAADIAKNLQRARNIEGAQPEIAPPDPFSRFETPNPDALPEPNRTQPPPGYLDRFRQPPAGGADVPSRPGMTPMFAGMEPPPPAGPTFGERVSDVLGVPMSAKTTYDLSGPGRQLAPMLYAHPTAIPNVMRAQAKALRSAENFAASQQALREKPYAWARDLAKVEMGGLTEGLQREEQIGSNIAQKILPGSVRFNDAYTAAINEGRDWLFKSMFDQMPASMLTEQGLREGGIAELQRIGKIVNASTGRGSILKVLTENKVLGQPLLWAPKLLAGRLQLPLEMFSESPIVRKEAARQVVSFVGTNLALLGMMKATGAADVELDPRSSDWGTIRIGQRRYDPWAGYKPMVNLVARLGVSAKNTLATQAPSLGLATDTPNTKGITSAAGVEGALGSKAALNVITDFLRSKLAPSPGEAVNQWVGKDITGADVTRAIGDYGGKNVGRAEHAILGTLAPIFAESLAQELGYTVPEGARQGGTAGALAEVGKSVAGNIPWLGGMGGGYYQPRPQDLAAQGRYGDLSGPDQLQALGAQSWSSLAQHPDLTKELRAVAQRYPSHYAWQSSFLANTEKAYEQNGYTPSNALQLARQALAQQPIQKAYGAVKNAYEGQWIRQNPAEAERIISEDDAHPDQIPRLTPSKADRAFIQQAVGGQR